MRSWFKLLEQSSSGVPLRSAALKGLAGSPLPALVADLCRSCRPS